MGKREKKPRNQRGKWEKEEKTGRRTQRSDHAPSLIEKQRRPLRWGLCGFDRLWAHLPYYIFDSLLVARLKAKGLLGICLCLRLKGQGGRRNKKRAEDSQRFL